MIALLELVQRPHWPFCSPERLPVMMVHSIRSFIEICCSTKFANRNRFVFLKKLIVPLVLGANPRSVTTAVESEFLSRSSQFRTPLVEADQIPDLSRIITDRKKPTLEVLFIKIAGLCIFSQNFHRTRLKSSSP